MEQELDKNDKEKELIRAIGEHIRDEREKIDMTIRELASLVDLSESFLASVERGEKSTSIYNLSKICFVLGRKLDDIVYGTDKTRITFFERPEESAEIKREKIKSLITNLDDSQLNFIIKSIKNLKELEIEKNKKY